ncbi:MAG: hypothetical protein FJY11_09345 [Bacteroidetes bacterium]|nr:hypothetical protein [Bacteroidota bacterium]
MMGRIILTVAAILIAVAACNRDDEDFLWEYFAGQGTAWFLTATPDSGYISAGDVGGKPYLMRSSRTGSKVYSYSAEDQGAYKSVMFDTAYCIAAGGSDGELILARVDNQGQLIWEKRVSSEIYVTEVFLFASEVGGEIVALCGSGPDDSTGLASGLMKVVFDTSGAVLTEVTRTESDFFRISGAVMNADGGFMVAVTKATGTARPKALAVKVDQSLATIRERELANNPLYGAASLSLTDSDAGDYFVGGRTELQFEGQLLMNSFAALITPTGTVIWKKYPENSNEATALIGKGNNGLIYVLNRNCFIVNILNETDGSEYRHIRFFDACDSYDTGRKAESFIINYAGNLLIAGSNSGKYYLALKPVIDE